MHTTSALAGRVKGEGRPPIVLLHGLVASGIYWGAAYDRLADDHRLIVPDLLGFGRSPRPHSGYGPDDHVDALMRVLDDLGVVEPAVIGAHSLGALIAIRAAVTHPERVARIVAFGPPLYPDRTSAVAHVGGTSPMGRLFVLPGRTAEIACRWVCHHRDLAARLAVLSHPSLPPPLAADGVQHTWESYSETIERVILAAAAHTWLDTVVCPVQLIAGDRDRVVDKPFLQELQKCKRSVTTEFWLGGHDLPLAYPGRCVAAIRDSSASLEGS